jgi:hypothetical protein
MKSKNLTILFLVFLILIFPLERVYAVEPITLTIIAGVTIIGAWLAGKAALGWMKEKVVQGMAGIIWLFAQSFHKLLWWINNTLLAQIVNAMAQLNPFVGKDMKEETSPVAVIWNILKSFAYILLVFSALAAAYEWLFGNDASAKRLIFNIIVVALIISFTYVLVKEAFLVVDSLEKGLSGGSSKKIGTIIAASLWQGDPFEVVEKIAKEVSEGEDTEVKRYIAEAVGYIFIVTLDMLIFIILIVVLFLFVARYVIFIFLAGTSSIAAASLTFPEFKGISALGEIMSQFRAFGTWFEYFVRWLLVVPILVILVLLGNILKENVLAQIVGSSSFSNKISFEEFIVLFILLIGWYLFVVRIAVKLSGAVGAFAKRLATVLLLIAGGIAAKGVMTATQGSVGEALKKAGAKIEEKAGVGGMFGWRSWVGQKIGAQTREIGEKMIERRYGLETESVKAAIGRVDEQLKKETDPAKIQNLTSQLSQLTQKYKNNDYISKSIGESIRKMSPSSAAKILASGENLKTLASSDSSQETREAVIGLVDKLKRSDLIKMAGDTEWLSALKEVSPDVSDTFVNKIGTELKETQGFEIISKDDVKSFISKLEKDDKIRKTFNNITKGFVNALLEKNIENISNAMASWDKDIWVPENTEKINNILRSQLSEEEIKTSILETIRKTENRSAIIRGALKEAPGGPLRTILGRLTDKERDELKKLLTPQDQATLEAIRGVIIP